MNQTVPSVARANPRAPHNQPFNVAPNRTGKKGWWTGTLPAGSKQAR